MADNGSSTAEDHKRDAETAAKVVLAKHPSVVAGATPPVDGEVDATTPKPINVGTQCKGRGLNR